MKKTKNLAVVLAAAVAICFALVSLLQSAPKPDKILQYEPIWEIAECDWVEHQPNPRFAICDPGTPDDDSDDLVLDTRTRIVWQRMPRGVTWGETECYGQAVFETYSQGRQAGVKGYRLPTLEEMLSLVDPTMSEPALPAGHPFIGVQYEDSDDQEGRDWYWTATDWNTKAAFVVNFKSGNISNRFKECNFPEPGDSVKVWRVWGGSARVDYLFNFRPEP